VEPRVTLLADQFTPSTFVDAFRFIPKHGHLLLVKTAEHVELSAAALGIGLLLALPLGLWLGHRHRGLFVALGASSLGRALPSVVLIAFGIAILGVGFWNNTAALVVLAVPPILTNAYFGVEGVDPDVVEAARGMGLTEAQILLRVELPLGLSLVVAGIRIAAVFVIATATIAAIAGGGGLGEIIVDQASYGLAGVVAGALCVSALALATAAALELVHRAVSRRHAPSA
jgi:osmoprotectant transport system permease protein